MSAKAVVGTFGSRVIVSLLNLMLLLATTQFFGAEARGEISLFVVWITMIAMVGQLFGGPVVVYFLKRIKPARLLFISYSFAIVVSILAWFIFRFFEYKTYIFAQQVCWIGLVHILSLIHLNVLIGLQFFSRYNAIVVAQSFIHFAVVAAGVAITQAKIPTSDAVIIFVFGALMAYGTTILMSLGTVLNFLNQPFEKEGDNKISVIHWFKQGLRVQSANVLYLMVTRSSFFWVEHFAGLAALGIFSTACSIAEQSLLLSASIGTVIYGRISAGKIFKTEQVVFLCRMAATATIILLVVLVIVPASAFTFIVGRDFTYVGGMILLLIPGYLFQAISTVLSHYFSGLGKFKIPFWSSLLGAIAAVVLGYFVIQILGAEGAAITQNVAYLFAFLIFIFFFRKENRGKSSFLFFVLPSNWPMIKSEFKRFKLRNQ